MKKSQYGLGPYALKIEIKVTTKKKRNRGHKNVKIPTAGHALYILVQECENSLKIDKMICFMYNSLWQLPSNIAATLPQGCWKAFL